MNNRIKIAGLAIAAGIAGLIIGLIIGRAGRGSPPVHLAVPVPVISQSIPAGIAAPTASASPDASPLTNGPPGTRFLLQDQSNDTYEVTLDKLIDPAQGADQYTTPDKGTRFVAAVFTVKAVTGSPENEDANNDAVLVGTNGQTYTSDFSSILGYTDFSNGQIQVLQGQAEVGAVTFQVPDGVSIAKVQWTASGGFGSTVQWAS